MRSSQAVCFVAVGAVCAAAQAQYVQPFDADNGMWQTWVSSGNEPQIDHLPSGGVADSGHVSVDLAGIGFQGPLAPPNEFHYWAAYLYADDLEIGRFDFTDASVGVQLRGEDLDLQSGDLYFYISRYEAPSGANSIFRTETALVPGESSWMDNTLGLSGASWVPMVENGFTLGEVLAEATEFGFVVAGVGASDDDPSGVLGIDEFRTDAPRIPSPATAGVLALACPLALRRRR
jgi:hypothetical protein